MVAERNGVPVLVRHIAALTIGAVPRQGVIGQDDDPDIVTGIVLMRKGENPAVVLEAVKEKVDAAQSHACCPKACRSCPTTIARGCIDKTLKTVFTQSGRRRAAGDARAVLFLGNLRAAAIVALIIPLSLLGTFIGLTFLGIPANLLSLGAMDFGIIVDGAVIVVENMFRRLGERSTRTRRQPRAPCRRSSNAASEVGRPTLFSMLIIIAAHIPIFTLQRHEGRIFAPMAYSVTSALIASLIFSLTLVPLLCYLLLLQKNLPHEENRLVRWCKRMYKPALEWSLAHRGIVVRARVGRVRAEPRGRAAASARSSCPS